MSGGLDDENPRGADLRDEPVHDRGRDDHIVARDKVERPESGLNAQRALLHVEAFVADRVAVERRRRVGDDIGDAAVVVGEEVLPAKDRVGAAAVELVGLQMPGFQGPVRDAGVGRRLEGLEYTIADKALIPDDRIVEWVLLSAK